jgi:hypothetical protein
LKALAEKATTTDALPSSGRAAIRALIWRVASSPDNTGIRISIKMTWGCQLSQSATASSTVGGLAELQDRRLGVEGRQQGAQRRPIVRQVVHDKQAADRLARFEAEDGWQWYRVQRLGRRPPAAESG